jgi:hypothetical protein
MGSAILSRAELGSVGRKYQGRDEGGDADQDDQQDRTAAKSAFAGAFAPDVDVAHARHAMGKAKSA